MILAVILCGKIPFEDEIRYNVTYFGRATVFLETNLKDLPEKMCIFNFQFALFSLGYNILNTQHSHAQILGLLRSL